MPVAKKEKQTTNAGRKWKMAALISDSVKQTADTKWKKQNRWNHLRTPNGCLPANIRWKKHTHKNTTKSQQSNRLLSATKEWTTTVRRSQSKNNSANDKQMESQTNHN